MPAGRPLSIPTIVKRLRHLRDGVFYDQHQNALLLDNVTSVLSSNPNQPVKILDFMVRDLQGLLDRSSALSDSDAKMLTSCIDSLARIQASKVATKPVKLKPINRKAIAAAEATWIDDADEALDDVLDEEEAHASTKRRHDQGVMVFLLGQMLNQVTDGGELPAEFFAAMHLMVDVLDRLCE